MPLRWIPSIFIPLAMREAAILKELLLPRLLARGVLSGWRTPRLTVKEQTQ